MRALTIITAFLVLFAAFSCQNSSTSANESGDPPGLQIAGAMRNVMWKGELRGIIQLDTIKPRKGLYGLGPLSHLSGELLIDNGQVYISKVGSDSSLRVILSDTASAPFFVYGWVTEWDTIQLPTEIKNIRQLEEFVDQQTQTKQRPFPFKLHGRVNQAGIHVQNLPLGTTVSSPKEAHSGQVWYDLQDTDATIIGFFSTEHQGVFTHHDTYLHLHLLTADKQMMGHLDRVEMGSMQLLLPKR